MNKERLSEIASWLEAGAPHKCGIAGFYMPKVFEQESCRTTACLAGAALYFFGDKGCVENLKEDGYAIDSAEYAAKLLDISETDANLLFFPDSYGAVDDEGFDEGAVQNLRRVTPAWAARVVRYFIETGIVDWVGQEESNGAH